MSDVQAPRPPFRFKPKYVRNAEKRARRGIVKVVSRLELAELRRQQRQERHDQAQDQFRRERSERQTAIPNRPGAVWVVDQFNISGLVRADYAELHIDVDHDEQGSYASEIGSTLHHRVVGHLHRLLTGLPDQTEVEDQAREAAQAARVEREIAVAREGLEALFTAEPDQAVAVYLDAHRCSVRQIAAQMGVNRIEAALLLGKGRAYLGGYVAARAWALSVAQDATDQDH